MSQLIPALMGGTLAAAALCLSFFLLLTRRRRFACQQQTERILALQRKIDAALRDDGGAPSREPFGASLEAASLTTSLQRPRLDTMTKIGRQPPEKYRILAKLAAQGMDSDQVASILGISGVEAAQLLSLCHVAKIGR